MLRTNRINMIRDYVFEHETVSLDHLVSEFNVSKNTIRRDIQALVDGGELKKVYGGVTTNVKDIPKAAHTEKRQQPATLLAKSAANFVEEGDIIFIDSGQTMIDMLEFLKEKQLTIITNNLDFIMSALPFENLRVISTGGLLDHKNRSFSILHKEDLLIEYNINKAFMAPNGISISRGVTHSTPMENHLKQTIVEKSLEVYLLANYDKFDKYALMTYGDLEEINYIITDVEPNEKYIQFANENDVNIKVAE